LLTVAGSILLAHGKGEILMTLDQTPAYPSSRRLCPILTKRYSAGSVQEVDKPCRVRFRSGRVAQQPPCQSWGRCIPRLARERLRMVTLGITVTPSGKIRSAAIRSSGRDVLDQRALAVGSDIAPVSPCPREEDHLVAYPVVFTLSDRP
jgi:TonB family protein